MLLRFLLIGKGDKTIVIINNLKVECQVDSLLFYIYFCIYVYEFLRLPLHFVYFIYFFFVLFISP